MEHKNPRKRLPDTDVFLDSIAPLGKVMRITFDISVHRVFNTYRGVSAHGPCLFYHHPGTDTWVVLCRNQARRVRLPPVLTQETARNPLVCSTVRNLLGSPSIMVIPRGIRSGDAPTLISTRIPGFSSTGAAMSTPWMDLFRAMQRPRPDIRLRATFAGMSPVCGDGDLVWAVWRPSGALREQVRTRFSEEIAEKILDMVGPLPQAGFTGFYLTDLLIEDNGMTVRCLNNPEFWAKRLEGPTHYWEEDDALLRFRPLTPPPLQQMAETDAVSDASDEDD